MIQEEQKPARPSTSGLEYSRHESTSFAPERSLPTNGHQVSQGWISDVKRFFETREGNKASYVSSIMSSRLFKFLVVGGIGVVVNLVVMALLIKVGYSRDWRASAIASAVAALHNYLLNNHWTFGDRRRNGRALVNGAFLYLPLAAAGIAVTTVSYSILTQSRFLNNFGVSSFYLLGAQLISILFGTFLNYNLNKVFTWRLDRNEL
jgi:putative flippase GtrA